VVNQSEAFEFYTNFDGCFQLPPPCVNATLLKYHMFRTSNKNPLTDWLMGLTFEDNAANRSSAKVTAAASAKTTERDKLVDRFTVALTRFDYANMYWVVNDWYNTYLMARFFNQTPETVHVIHVDAHPRGLLDATWSTLFGGSAIQLSQLPTGRTKYKNLVWGLATGFSPFVSVTSATLYEPPYVDRFHRFVVTQHGLADPDERRLDCSNISVLFIWRRDYVAHPRNPTGLVKVSAASQLNFSNARLSKFPCILVPS
jgi:glycoprotein 2-beta-D-xylosyltransferase